MTATTTPRLRGRFFNGLLWALALLIMFSAIVYQRRTGPTYPRRGEIVVAGESHRYRLVRSQETTREARVLLPAAGGRISGTLYWKRFKREEPWRPVDLCPAADLLPGLGGREQEELADRLVALLPMQPPAGKLEYFIELTTPHGLIRIPEDHEEAIVIRYKDPVPGHVLWPHVVLMFFAVLVGMRAGLSALADPGRMRRQAWVALGGMSLGGMVLGPLVQKFAFGHYWTGFPLGRDLTDNKMLVMWLAWILACSIIGLRARPREILNRLIVVLAAVVMTGAYLIPHSMRGSELDYSKLEQGVDPRRAIGTSDH
ncbi:MAG: hypothetical protein Q8O14_01245 [bacterium]|jgi:hypothetical protein|nr:hypothetical protein [bacterium]